MREKQFVEQNKQKWGRFEQVVSGDSPADPEELSELFSNITDDLSYARTYYGRRSIRVYLNSLAQKVYLNLYKNRRGIFRGFRAFWSEELPLALYRSRRELNISLLFFALAMGIGVLSSAYDPGFSRVVLGDDYIEMTERNIAKGDPMAVYKTSGEVSMFLGITLNNLLVAFRTFVLGAFFGVGTLLILLYNGVMVGSFQYFFIERSLLQESFLTIWMHGALEISAIVIAGAAGLTLGRGILFPGSLPRGQSIQLGARRSITIMLGLVPIFMAAAFIEGFFTRLTGLPDLIRGAFIFLCFIFVGSYFWLYPWLKFRHNPVPLHLPEELVTDLSAELDLSEIRKSREIFTGTFTILRKLFTHGVVSALLLSVAYGSLFWLLTGNEGLERVNFRTFAPYNLYQFHSYQTFPVSFMLNVLFISSVLWLAMRQFIQAYNPRPEANPSAGIRLFLKAALLVTLFELFILSGNGLVATLGITFIPFLIFWYATAAVEGLSLPAAFSRMLKVLNGTRRYVFITFLYMGALSVLLLFLFDSPFTWLYFEVIQMNLDVDNETKQHIAILSLLVINQLGLALVLPLLLFSQLLEYYSATEAKEAEGLSQRVMLIGRKMKAYGMERE